MKPLLRHNNAMDLACKGQNAFDIGNFDRAISYYKKAALIETNLVEFYLYKSELEPTRSILIRSAIFLNIKAKEFDIAEKLILFGLGNLTDEFIKDQLIGAFLQIRLAETVSNIDFDKGLTNRLHYQIEPLAEETNNEEIVTDFKARYLKSLKMFMHAYWSNKNININIDDVYYNLAESVITNDNNNILLFSIDGINGSKDEKYEFQKEIIWLFHNNILKKSLSLGGSIADIVSEYKLDDMYKIFYPLLYKSKINPYKIGFYDREEQYKYEILVSNKIDKTLIFLKSKEAKILKKLKK